MIHNQLEDVKKYMACKATKLQDNTDSQKIKSYNKKLWKDICLAGMPFQPTWQKERDNKKVSDGIYC